MDSGSPCQRHDEQIKTLTKKVDSMENVTMLMYSLDKNMAVQTSMLEHIVEHNVKQDLRMDKQEDRSDKQDAIMGKMSISLTELNDELKGVKSDVDIVKDVQSDNEMKHNVDLRDIEKGKYVDYIVKYTLPLGGAAVIIWQIMQFLK